MAMNIGYSDEKEVYTRDLKAPRQLGQVSQQMDELAKTAEHLAISIDSLRKTLSPITLIREYPKDTGEVPPKLVHETLCDLADRLRTIRESISSSVKSVQTISESTQL